MRFRHGPLALALLLTLPGLAHAGVRSEVSARRVGVQDQVQLTITVDGSAAAGVQSVPPPPLRNLRLAGGPSVSTQVSFVNGQMSQSKTFTYLLQPGAVGAAEVGAVELELGGELQRTEVIAIEVVEGRVQPARPQRRRLDPFGGDPFEDFFGRREPRQRADPKLFVEARPSRRRLHVGEALLLTYYLHTQNSVSDIRLADAPQYPGFWSEDLDDSKRQPRSEVVEVEGERYQRFPILRRLLFPTRAGELSLPAAAFRVGVVRQSFFDSGAVVERSTQALDIEVLPLPDEPGFSGAVGQFEVSAHVDRDRLALGDAVTLSFAVRGTGNLKWIEDPPQLSIENVELYPPQEKSHVSVGPDGMAGSKTWEFVVVPETAGELQIPGIAFTYFDPRKGSMVRSGTAPIPLHVEGGAGEPASVPVRGMARDGMLPLRADLDLARSSLPSLSGRAVLLGLGLVLLLHVGLWAGTSLANARRREGGRAASRPSVRRALAQLSRAGRDNMTKEAAAALIEKTLHDVFGPLGADGSQPGDERERTAREVLHEVEFVRYAPQLGDYSEKIREIAARAAEVVRRWA